MYKMDGATAISVERLDGVYDTTATEGYDAMERERDSMVETAMTMEREALERIGVSASVYSEYRGITDSMGIYVNIDLDSMDAVSDTLRFRYNDSLIGIELEYGSCVYRSECVIREWGDTATDMVVDLSYTDSAVEAIVEYILDRVSAPYVDTDSDTDGEVDIDYLARYVEYVEAVEGLWGAIRAVVETIGDMTHIVEVACDIYAIDGMLYEIRDRDRAYDIEALAGYIVEADYDLDSVEYLDSSIVIMNKGGVYDTYTIEDDGSLEVDSRNDIAGSAVEVAMDYYRSKI